MFTIAVCSRAKMVNFSETEIWKQFSDINKKIYILHVF